MSIDLHLVSRRAAALRLALLAAGSLCAFSAPAATILTNVGSQAGPWSQATNSSFDYGLGDNGAPTIVHGLTAGESVAISAVSGTTTEGSGFPAVDANGLLQRALAGSACPRVAAESGARSEPPKKE